MRACTCPSTSVDLKAGVVTGTMNSSHAHEQGTAAPVAADNTEHRKKYSRVLTRGGKSRALVTPELREADAATVDGDTKQRQLELHAPVLEHPPPLNLDGARERHVGLLLYRAMTMRRACGPDDLGDEEQVLWGNGER